MCMFMRAGRCNFFSQYLLSALSNWLSYSFRLLYKDSNISKDLSGMELT